VWGDEVSSPEAGVTRIACIRRARGGDLTLQLFGRRRNLIRQRGKFQPERYREKKASREIQTAARVIRAPAGNIDG
jgi:hypothetical protein